ncbi:hypothetical protein SAXI111661_08870 [Saccharomonospora xinjiangensis]|uniref:hypothetical protein n=1 Tax=Saccharomonospora xinjiangensis TaxID=75294 RepID=UPI00106FDB9A|nr:hypothetical protein [Saccharomonospora xinjiangensis]QBQ61732.1 hypothetical protein EYD13_16940 [Saccharomonospora xinjiangensis]
MGRVWGTDDHAGDQADEGGPEDALLRKAQRALIAAALADEEDALAAIGPDGLRGELPETRELILLLFGACSAMIASLGEGGSRPVKVQVFDEAGEEVPIDRADPPMRTAVRTLLAEVHGNTDAAADQVEIALANAAPSEVDSVVLAALHWTLRLAVECLDRDLPVPAWVESAFSD